jgi:3-methyladenine DNA glycosylase/8-oxoguanine DNA glycosylase
MSVKIEEIKPNKENEAVVTAVLRPTTYFDFKNALEFIKASGAEDKADKLDTANLRLERAILLDGKPFLVRLTALSSDEQAPALGLELQADDHADHPPSQSHVSGAAEWANRRFFLDVDMHAVREAIAVNEYGEDLANRFFPARPVNLSNAWDGLLRTVIANQIYPGLAARLQQGLLDLYGRIVHFEGKEYRFFPAPEKVAAIAHDELTAMKFSRQKAGFLPGIAQKLLAEPEKYDFERLRTLPAETAVAILDELPGVGEWTAHYVAMRGLPHQDVFINENGLRKTLAAHYDRRAETAEGMATLTKVFSPYRSFACYYTYMLMYSA